MHITLEDLAYLKKLSERYILPLSIGNWDEIGDKISKHHINRDRKDNRPENLVKIPRWYHDILDKQHRHISDILELRKKCFTECVNKKIISFDIKHGYNFDIMKVRMVPCSGRITFRRMISRLLDDHKWKKSEWTFEGEEL